MTVHVKLYAGLRRYKPDAAIGQTFPCNVADNTTVARLLTDVLNLPAQVAIVLVNGVQRDADYALRDGDTIALWPPIAGG